VSSGIDQRAVIDFLGCPRTYGVANVERIETHGNLIFLAGDDAFKIKRAVRFDYMDFSTLQTRRVACEREVSLNRKWAPDLYLGCIPITRTNDGSLAFGGKDDVVEWAVHMRRFDQGDLLSTRGARREVDSQLATELADVVYASHQDADRIVNPAGIGTYRDLTASICGGLAGYNILKQDDVSHLKSGLERQLARSGAIIEERATHGFVRRCHGDLHLANVVLHQGRPMLYDAIEFDDTLASIDTLYDLAFLLMDLEFQGLREAANVVLNRYLWRSGEKRDLRGLATLPLFQGLRAAIRALVTMDRAAQKASEVRECDIERAQRYLGAALAYEDPPAPALVVIGGLSGAGKTTLATAIAPRLGAAPGAVHLRSDLERKTLAGVSELVRLPAAAYTPEARQRVYSSLHEKAQLVLGAGHSLIVDAVYDSERDRSKLENLAKSLGVSMQGLWLRADPAIAVARVAARQGDASDATPNVVQAQFARGVGPLSGQWILLDASTDTTTTLQAALAAMRL
jgi:aminoglycoside phosphotransferase family enzyme/predicted kinase